LESLRPRLLEGPVKTWKNRSFVVGSYPAFDMYCYAKLIALPLVVTAVLEQQDLKPPSPARLLIWRNLEEKTEPSTRPISHQTAAGTSA